jgi:DNA-binding response OmpR family regulator
MKNILIIEDDKEINGLLCKTLQNNGYGTVSALTGIEGLEHLKKERFDMILLDLMLPYKSGDTVLHELRKFTDIPVIVISAKDLIQTKIDLLRLGADDYITKPFDIDEVIARIEANLRRRNFNKSEGNQIIVYKDIMMDVQSKQVIINGKDVMFTATEFKIMELLLSHPQKVFSKANLFESIWEEEYTVDDNTLNVHISRLRHKLKEAYSDMEYIETLWGID